MSRDAGTGQKLSNLVQVTDRWARESGILACYDWVIWDFTYVKYVYVVHYISGWIFPILRIMEKRSEYKHHMKTRLEA